MESSKKEGITSFSWTMMIMQPDLVTMEIVDEAINIAKEKKKDYDFSRMYLKERQEHEYIQAFHLGDYEKMNETLKEMVAEAEKMAINTLNIRMTFI